ncbi:MAG: hypothetical protein AB7S93_22025 [Xanthobacteraceae bacterium]
MSKKKSEVDPRHAEAVAKVEQLLKKFSSRRRRKIADRIFHDMNSSDGTHAQKNRAAYVLNEAFTNLLNKGRATRDDTRLRALFELEKVSGMTILAHPLRVRFEQEG